VADRIDAVPDNPGASGRDFAPIRRLSATDAGRSIRYDGA
jgi:hypothetical protein